MAGIGEASAILSVAQIGISLSKTLITYIEEVKGAPSHIQRIGNELLTTSERLKDIGELVKQNPQTKVFSEEGISSAVRCSTECQQIIKEVKSVLFKGGWQDYPKESDKDELDTSLFSHLRWPFAKIKLEVPRAELHRIKLDLSLLFSAAMVLRASTATERQRLAQDIPELHKARTWAAKRAEKVKEMAQYRTRNSRAHDMPWSDDEPEMLEEFLTFKERLFSDEEEKRVKERADIMRAEDNAQKQKEEDAQREVEREAVEKYKRTQRDQKARSAEKRDNFRKELERLGFESAQIQLVMDSSNLDFQAASGMAFIPEVRPTAPLREISSEQETTQSTTSGWSRLNLPWRRTKRSTRESSSESSLSSVLLENSSGLHSKLIFETWLLDDCTHQSTELLPSNDWLREKFKSVKKDQEVWSRFARLRPYWRGRIFAFLEFKKQDLPGWTLYYLETPQKRPRTRLFGQRHDDQSMLLILSRRRLDDLDSDVAEGEPKVVDPGGGLPKRVTFVEEVREESGTERGYNAPQNDVLARNPSSLRERLTKLVEKRNGLGLQDYERIADLNDMIDYLQDQLKPVVTQNGTLNTETSHDERKSQPIVFKSDRSSVPLHGEHIPKFSTRDEIIIDDRRYGRGPSPPPSPPWRQSNTDANSIASRYPRQIWDIPERYSSPERIGYEDRYGVRNQSRNGRRLRRREEEDIIFRHRDHDRSSQRGWSERSRSRSRPSRQDSFDTRGGSVAIRARDRSYERSRPPPMRPSRQVSKVTDKYDDLERQTLANDIRPIERTSEREEEIWSPISQGVVVRRDQSSKPRLHNRPYSSSSESEYSYNGSRVRRGQPVVGTSGQSQALVLRAGASGHHYEYIRGRVLNGGIRVRGDDDVDSPPLDPAFSHHVREASRQPFSRRNSYRDRSWAPSLRRRLSETWHQFDSSEEEQSRYRMVKRIDSEKDKPESELSDAEVIAQTLKQYTTMQDRDMPTTGVSAPSFRTNKASEMEVGRSALKKAPHALSGPDSKRSIPVPGRKAHFEKENDAPQIDHDGLGKATNEGSNSVDETSVLDKISEEPDVMNEDKNSPPHQEFVYFSARPAPPGPQPGRFPLPPDRAPSSREALSRSPSRDSNPDSPRIGRGDEPTVSRHDSGETPDHETPDEAYDDVEIMRTISRNPTVHEEVD